MVTGHLGFIGRNLARRLSGDGVDVLGVGEDVFDTENWEHQLIVQVESFEPVAVFHVGACSDTLEVRSQYIMERNFEATKVLVDWCKRKSIPLIYSSSAANYGVNERYPSNLYGWSKYVGEAYASANNCVSLRYFNVYGPGEEDKSRMASFFHQAFVSRKAGIVPKLFPGSPKRDFIYVDDVVTANLVAYENYLECSGKIYDVGTADPRTFEQALDILGIPYEHTTSDAIPAGYQEFTCANVGRRLPNWTPKFSLERGLTDYLEYLEIGKRVGP